MSVGLIALLDDVLGLAKVAAASLDDAAAQAAKAGVKAAGVVVDDAAVTPRYVVGLDPARELPIIGRIALGSLKNKLLYLLPASLALSIVAPWAITPLLVLGGLYLCFEGAEKVIGALRPRAAHAAAPQDSAGHDPAHLEEARVAGAIKTDFILSAEIMAITLASVAELSFAGRAGVLAIVGTGITGVVYGAVALIVKADDVGVALATNDRPASTALGLRAVPLTAISTPADRALRPFTRGLGRGLVKGMPPFLTALSVLGTAAMLWVGGGIVWHGLEGYGWTALGHGVHAAGAFAAGLAPAAAAGAARWVAEAATSGVIGLALGAALVPLAHVVVPLVARLRGRPAPAH